MLHNYLNDLNEAQKEAVINTEGPALIIAGAGSGKTRVLTYRIAHLLEKGVKANRILALTFTNKAAGEMKERIMNIVGEENARSLWMGTFHSIFAKFLRHDGSYLGYKSNFTIYDTDNTRSLLRTIIKEMQLDDAVYKPAAVASRISHAKNNLITAQQYSQVPQISDSDRNSKVPEMASVYRTYAVRCFKANAMDFDDLLLNMNILFRDFPAVLEEYRRRFDYILVDEYQDTNYSQYVIVRKLSELSRNLCVVGDDAQSIYSFRGARIENMLNFKNDYPDFHLFKLEQNYRSTQTIVNAANSIIGRNEGQIKKTVFSKNDVGEKIRIVQTITDGEEGALISSDILDTRMRDHVEWKDFAILYRTNAQSRIFEEMLRKRNIPYKVYGGTSFYERKEIRDIIAYLRLAVNPDDAEALKRIINYPKRGIGDTTVTKLAELAQNLDISVWTLITSETYFSHLSPALRSKLIVFTNLMKPFADRAGTDTAYEFANAMAQASGIISDLRSSIMPEDRDRLENIQELLNGIREFTDYSVTNGEPADIGTYLATVSLLTEMDRETPEEKDKVTMMTIHSAKGLEFRHVYIVGMEENLFPSNMNVFNPRELEEERRLFYVAVTRACTRVTLSYTLNRYKWGNLERTSPSRFIADIDKEFVTFPQTGGKPFGQSGVEESGTPFINDTPKPVFTPVERKLRRIDTPVRSSAPSPVTLADISAGDMVKHERFGAGKVIAIDGAAPNTTATIDFGEGGVKKLLLRFAKLEKI
jgi:DNA helicase II / ATP-dependent DNA helicase PcrA